jgi:hypothetical protein
MLLCQQGYNNREDTAKNGTEQRKWDVLTYKIKFEWGKRAKNEDLGLGKRQYLECT